MQTASLLCSFSLDTALQVYPSETPKLTNLYENDLQWKRRLEHFARNSFDATMRQFDLVSKQYNDFKRNIPRYIAVAEASVRANKNQLSNKTGVDDNCCFIKRLKKSQSDLRFLRLMNLKMQDHQYKAEYIENRGLFEGLSQFFPGKSEADIKKLYSEGANLRSAFSAEDYVEANGGKIPPTGLSVLSFSKNPNAGVYERMLF